MIGLRNAGALWYSLASVANLPTQNLASTAQE